MDLCQGLVTHCRSELVRAEKGGDDTDRLSFPKETVAGIQAVIRMNR